jgi:hypothetical protein
MNAARFFVFEGMSMKRTMIVVLALCATAMGRDAAMQMIPASLFFVANEGQWEEPFAFKAAVGNAVYYVTPTGMTIDIRQYDRPQRTHDPMDRFEMRHEPEPMNVRGHVLRFTFLNANPHPEIIGENKLSSYSNYFIGRDSCKWRSFVGHYQKVRMKNVWNGIDVEYRIQSEGVETLYRVQAGADASQIMVQYDGLEAPLRTDSQGNLLLQTSLGIIKEKAPFAYQIVNHRQVEVPVQYRVLANDKYRLSFEAFDTGQELVIDPLVYGTFFAGANGDFVTNMDIDSIGNVVLSGYTYRSNFPTTSGVYQDTTDADVTGFVSKLNSQGTELIFSTYFPSDEFVRVNQSGSIDCVCSGETSDWPLTPNAFDTVSQLDEIGIACLSADGAHLEFGSYLGGSNHDFVEDCAIDSLGRLYICGETDSPDFPTTPNALFRGAPRVYKAFTTILGTDRATIIFSTFFSDSSGWNQAGKIVPVSSGEFWIIINAMGPGMPLTPDALQTDWRGWSTPYFARADFDHSMLLYGSYLGGYQEALTDLIPADSNRIWLVGELQAPPFPMPPGGFSTVLSGQFDCFAMELRLPDSVCHATFVGGPDNEYPFCAARTEWGSLIFVGQADGDSFPTTADAISRHYSGGTSFETGDLIVCVLSPDLSVLQYSTYLGGHLAERLGRAVYGGAGRMWLAGTTDSPDFPVSANAMYHQFSNSYLVRMGFSGQSVPHFNRPELPKHLTLSCFPNPFNPITTISFSLPQSSSVQFDVFDVLGRTVHHKDFGRLNAGTHRHEFDASSLSSGVYFARLTTAEEIRITKLLLLR